jgi:multidrug efflux pump
MGRALGVAVFSGMLGVTLFGIFLTPVFFYVIRWFSRPPVVQAQTAHGPEGASLPATETAIREGPGH